VYGDPNPANAASYTGLVNGDVATTLTGTLAFGGTGVTAVASTNVGDYPITPSGLTSGDYTIAFADGKLTITQAPLSVTPAGATRVFGAANPPFTGTVTGIKASDPITASYSTAANPASNVGSYDITASLNDPNARLGNYSVTLNKGTLTITKATPTVVWATPNPVPQGTALSATQLNATTSGVTGQPVGGGLTYVPPAGTPEYNVGAVQLATSFNSTDPNYTNATGAVQLQVTNVAPVVNSITLGSVPIALGGTASITASFTDPGINDAETATINWDDGQTLPGTVSNRTVTGSHIYASAGVYTITITVTDNNGGVGSRMSSVETIGYIVVYDPSAGFVTGGGWINSPQGACRLSSCALDGSTVGKATFGFNAKYQKGANQPDGNTEFQFQAGGLNFKSTTYSWLVVAGTKAQYKGAGTVNGKSGYTFMLTAIDGDSKGSPDAFRMKIMDASGLVVYDNQMGSLDDSSNATSLGGGSIVIHQ
jgi:hypothetical protein